MSLPSGAPDPKRKCGCHCQPECRCACSCTFHCSCRQQCTGDCHKTQARNLVVSIDAPYNSFGVHNTNVVELHSRIITDNLVIPQLTVDLSSAGNYASPSLGSIVYWRQVILRGLDITIAWTFEKQVRDAYKWLATHYEPGDKIFLFGFARGAYQIRALAGMIEEMGLVHPGYILQIPRAYALYKTGLKRREFRKEETATAIRKHFKKTYSRQNGVLPEGRKDISANGVRVHFVGAWDTVSSIGICRGRPPLTASANHICHFRHALALDERRAEFLPEYFIPSYSQTFPTQHTEILETVSDVGNPQEAPGSRNIPLTSNAVDTKAQDGAQQQTNGRVKSQPDIKEVWFAGTHFDIGGGARNNVSLDLAGVPLLWMENEACRAGLYLKPRFGSGVWSWETLEIENPIESLRGPIWRFLEMLPLSRSTYNPQNPGEMGRSPHMGRGREIMRHQLIHASIAFKKNYLPRASLSRFHTALRWDSLIGQGSLTDISWAVGTWQAKLEMDLFDSSVTRDVGRRLKNDVDLLKRIPFLTLTADGVSGLVAEGVVDDLIQLSTNHPLAYICLGHMLQQPRHASDVWDKLKLEVSNLAVFLSSEKLEDCAKNKQIGRLFLLAVCLDRRFISGAEISTEIWTNVLRASSKILQVQSQAGVNCVSAFICTDEFIEALVTYVVPEEIQELIPEIGKLLRGDSCILRHIAVDTIGRLAKRPGFRRAMQPFVLPIGQLLQDVEVREAAARTLSELSKHPIFSEGIRQLVPQLGILLKDENSKVRCIAVNTIGTLSKTSTFHLAIKPFVSEIPDLFMDTDADAREGAAIAVRKFAEHPTFSAAIQQLVPKLGKLLNDENSKVQRTAMNTIGSLAMKAEFHPVIKPFVLQISKLLGETNDDVREGAANAIGKLADQPMFAEDIRQLIPEIGKLLTADSENVQSTAVNTMLSLANQPERHGVIKPFVREIGKLLADTGYHIRNVGASAVVKLADQPMWLEEIQQLIPELGELLNVVSWEVRRTAVETIGSLAHNSNFHEKIMSVVPEIRKLLADTNEYVRVAATIAVGELAEQAVFSGAIRPAELITQIGKLLNDSHWPVRHTAVMTIERFHSTLGFNEAIKPLLPEIAKLVADTDDDVRTAAASVLVTLAEQPALQDAIKGSVSALGKFLKDGHRAIRAAAVTLLGTLSQALLLQQAIRPFVQQIGKLRADDDEDVRVAATAAIAKSVFLSLILDIPSDAAVSSQQSCPAF